MPTLSSDGAHHPCCAFRGCGAQRWRGWRPCLRPVDPGPVTVLLEGYPAPGGPQHGILFARALAPAVAHGGAHSRRDLGVHAQERQLNRSSSSFQQLCRGRRLPPRRPRPRGRGSRHDPALRRQVRPPCAERGVPWVPGLAPRQDTVRDQAAARRMQSWALSV